MKHDTSAGRLGRPCAKRHRGHGLARLRSCATIIGLLAIVNPSAAEPFKLSPEQIATLATGSAVVDVTADPEGGAGVVRAAIDIPAEPGQVWATMIDCERAPRFVKGLKSCRVLERDNAGLWDVREHIVQWLSLLPSTRSEFRSEYVQERSIRFRRTGGDLKALDGEWQLMPLKQGRGTRLTYVARVDPGLPLPDAMVRAAIEADLPRTLEALRHEAVSATPGR